MSLQRFQRYSAWQGYAKHDGQDGAHRMQEVPRFRPSRHERHSSCSSDVVNPKDNVGERSCFDWALDLDESLSDLDKQFCGEVEKHAWLNQKLQAAS